MGYLWVGCGATWIARRDEGTLRRAFDNSYLAVPPEGPSDQEKTNNQLIIDEIAANWSCAYAVHGFTGPGGPAYLPERTRKADA